MNEIIKKNGVTYGIILGILLILISTSIYVIDLELFTSYWITGIKTIVYITVFVLVLTKTKKELNEIFPFKDAFVTYFITAIIGIALVTLFEILLFNVIDPSAKDTIKEIVIKKTVETMQNYVPKEAINGMIVEMNKQDSYSIGNQSLGLAISYLFAAVFGLILAAIFKSKNQEIQ